MSTVLRLSIYALTALAWALLFMDAIPAWPELHDDFTRVLVMVATVGTLEAIITKVMPPARELYMAGKIAGRAECLAESCGTGERASVVKLADYR